MYSGRYPFTKHQLPTMHRILFICSGNMYRSAGAEFILRKKLDDPSGKMWMMDPLLDDLRAKLPMFGRLFKNFIPSGFYSICNMYFTFGLLETLTALCAIYRQTKPCRKL